MGSINVPLYFFVTAHVIGGKDWGGWITLNRKLRQSACHLNGEIIPQIDNTKTGKPENTVSM